MVIWCAAAAARRCITVAAKACPKMSRKAGVVVGTSVACASARRRSAATCSFIAPAAQPPFATIAFLQTTAVIT